MDRRVQPFAAFFLLPICVFLRLRAFRRESAKSGHELIPTRRIAFARASSRLVQEQEKAFHLHRILADNEQRDNAELERPPQDIA